MKSIEEIKNDVAFNYGYINWDGYISKLVERVPSALRELDSITNDVARFYSRDAELYYDVNEDLEARVKELEDEVSDLEFQNDCLQSEVDDLEEENVDLQNEIIVLEAKINQLEDELDSLSDG